MKKLFLILITAASLAACTEQSALNAYIDSAGDCIFENNMVRYRINGAANPVVTSGMEAIFKAVVDKEQIVKDRKCAEAASFNDGGSAIVMEDSLVFPIENFASFELIEQTPKLVTFKLVYPAWPVGEDSVSLVRTVTLREGSLYCEVSDIYSNGRANEKLTVAAGFTKHGSVRNETGADYIINWEDMPDGDGSYGIGIVVPMSGNLVFDGPANSAVAYINTRYGRKVEYAAGSCWSRGTVQTFDNWADKVRL